MIKRTIIVGVIIRPEKSLFVPLPLRALFFLDPTLIPPVKALFNSSKG